MNGFVVNGTKGYSGAATDPNSASKQHGIYVASTSYDITLTNNIVNNNTGHGIANGSDGSLMEANVLYCNGLDVTDSGLYDDGYADSINGNIALGNSGHGIYCPLWADNQFVSNNQCFKNGESGIVYAGSDGRLQLNTSAANRQGIEYGVLPSLDSSYALEFDAPGPTAYLPLIFWG